MATIYSAILATVEGAIARGVRFEDQGSRSAANVVMNEISGMVALAREFASQGHITDTEMMGIEQRYYGYIDRLSELF